MKIIHQIAAVCLLFSVACKKDTTTTTPEPTPTPSGETGGLKIEFANMVDTLPLTYGTKYINANGDTFTVSKFNYYISNIVLTKTDNSIVSESNSYHLIRHSASGNTISFSSLPAGTYKSIKFMLGVDSTRNVSGSQTGDLDPAKATDMYWSWNTGYIFVKLEGSSPQSGDLGKALTFHIGGYGGPNKTQRNFSFDFGSTTATIGSAATPTVRLLVDASEMFKNPTKTSFATTYNQTSPGTSARIIADNYADMIRLKYVRN
ncbi:MAG: hypothetical protein IT236_09100 [Bacteroidia bacterium]|nr:hypothetical protein [Bacteroidia bacterium]